MKSSIGEIFGDLKKLAYVSLRFFAFDNAKMNIILDLC